jgi:NAD(P)-dependent dehydrogenase (short-subunit alcohol dehydrogenase family)
MPLALVTGAGARLGAEIARHLAKNGYKVIVHVNRGIENGRKVVKEITDAGNSAAMMSGDLRRPANVARLFEKLVKQHGLPQLIVNNASVFRYDFPGKGQVELLEDSLSIHVKAPYVLTELAYRKATRARPVTIVNILDQKLRNLNPDYFSYTLGKFGLLALTNMWQMVPTNRLRVFGILPGLLFPSGKQTTADFKRVQNNTLFGRNPTPQEIAAAVLFLAQSKSMPGQNVIIDGGEHLVKRARDIAYE